MMKKLKKRNIGSHAPATKGDVEQLREDVHADMVEHFATKEDLREFATKGDLKGFATKEDFKTYQKRQDRKHKELLEAFKAHTENLISAMQGAHNDELATVEGKKDASLTWKSVPRRLNEVEMSVEKIKDHLEIS